MHFLWQVPTFAYEKRLSRIETLRLAITYISFMTELLASEEAGGISSTTAPSHHPTGDMMVNSSTGRNMALLGSTRGPTGAISSSSISSSTENNENDAEGGLRGRDYGTVVGQSNKRCAAQLTFLQ